MQWVASLQGLDRYAQTHYVRLSEDDVPYAGNEQ